MDDVSFSSFAKVFLLLTSNEQHISIPRGATFSIVLDVHTIYVQPQYYLLCSESISQITNYYLLVFVCNNGIQITKVS